MLSLSDTEEIMKNRSSLSVRRTDVRGSDHAKLPPL
jgi:hypothetical protein